MGIGITSHSLISLCQYTKDHKKNGKCYFYNGESIQKICNYENGIEKVIIKEFKNNIMTVFDKGGNIVYEGEFEDSLESDYPRNGDGNEIQNGECIYSGEWKKNRKEGKGNSLRNGVVYYEGEWKDSVPEGEGILYDNNMNVRY